MVFKKKYPNVAKILNLLVTEGKPMKAKEIHEQTGVIEKHIGSYSRRCGYIRKVINNEGVFYYVVPYEIDKAKIRLKYYKMQYGSTI